MTPSDAARRENETLREGIAALHAERRRARRISDGNFMNVTRAEATLEEEPDPRPRT